MTATLSVVVSRRPSPLGEMIGVLIVAPLILGGTVSVMNFALSIACSSGRVPS